MRRAPAGRGRIAVIAVTLLLLTTAHYATDPHAHEVHGLLFKATYLPIILAGLWFHMRGAVITSGLTSGAYLVHVFGQLSGHGSTWAWLADIALYNVVAFTTGLLSERRAQALSRAEGHARQAEENARALLRAEEAVRRNDRLRALGELAAGMAHEIRNPLGGIRGAAEVLRKDDTPPAARQEFGTLLEEEIVRLDGVVGNFLDFARTPEAETASVVPRELVDAVLLLLRPEAERLGVTTENAVPGDLVVRADPALLRQVLLNLCLNAVQAQVGGGSLRVEGRDEGGGAVLDVIDGGPGIPPERTRDVFDPYVTGRADGSGLGLPIAARLSESMGGSVDLVETGASGSRFRVSLPASCDSDPARG